VERIQISQACGGEVSLSFRWLGVAGVELKAGDQVLALDPFFTRPSLAGFFKPVIPNSELAAEKLPQCNVVLVTHSHWDHLMDVPAVLQHTGAVTYGSANTCQLLRQSGVPGPQVNEIHVGEKLSLGAFTVEVIKGQHSWIPFGSIFNGRLRVDLQPPLRLQDYRMDVCLGYRITVMGVRVLVCAMEPYAAEVLFAVAQESKPHYLRLLGGVQPHTFVPIHWDNFMRPSNKPLRRFARPGRMALWRLTMLARSILPHVNVIIPEIFKIYSLGGERRG
jgi:L-ascorbate metabolism protein UlaG (beta-lactamase superfamily)